MSLENNQIVVYPKKCPICGVPTIKAISVSNDEDLKNPTLWYFCSCGIMFQNKLPEGKPKDKSFNDKLFALKEYDDISSHLGKTYSPVIEELTYGRKMLDVGFGTGKHMEFMKNRGWVTFGIEKNKDTVENSRIIKGDFETCKKIYQGEYDLIWMGYVLHKFNNPIGCLQKAVSALTEDGVLFISTADIEFLYSHPNNAWIYWNSKENFILWSLNALVRELEKLNLNVILKRRNFASRYGYYHDIHIIAQKKYF